MTATAATAGALVLAGAAVVATHRSWQPWCRHWGATDAEAEASLPGDELLGTPDIVTTRAVRIAAPPSAVWPWLVQMGPGRGGAYTYDWIENLAGLGMHSADTVLPEFQQLAVGDSQTLGRHGPVLTVAVLDPEAAMVLRSEDGNWVWAFVLVPDGTGTRLVSRNRIAVPGASWAARAGYTYVMEPGSLLMERKMLLGIKARAERLAADPNGARTDPTPGATRVPASG
ncbi:MAG TPA: hypothetical protein VKG43_11760 [Acidimicrobiales bacterium]|nr:hypothetical protein [Acidimicrobiales bacterium]